MKDPIQNIFNNLIQKINLSEKESDLLVKKFLIMN